MTKEGPRPPNFKALLAAAITSLVAFAASGAKAQEAHTLPIRQTGLEGGLTEESPNQPIQSNAVEGIRLEEDSTENPEAALARASSRFRVPQRFSSQSEPEREISHDEPDSFSTDDLSLAVPGVRVRAGLVPNANENDIFGFRWSSDNASRSNEPNTGFEFIEPPKKSD